MPAPSPRLEAFLRLLTDRGMLRGVDRRLRIELALRELGEPADPRALHDLLVPLVARNREEQARFRELFDDFFGVGPAAARRSSTGIALPPSTTPTGPTKRSRVTIAAVVAASIVAVALLWRGPFCELLPACGEPVKPDTVVENPPTAGSRGPRNDPPPASRQLDTLADADAGLPAVAMNRGEAHVPGRIVGASFGSAAIIGLPMLLAAFGARRRRARAYATDDTRKRTPPLVYTPKPPKPPLFMSAEFFDAVRVAVRRQRMDGNRISVERTVEATIAAGGLPTLRYEPASRPPEYLILIERASAGDHQALLFDAMAQRMRQEGLLYIERYFYERDPRLCRREQGGPTTIDELQRRFHEHRLVIFGDGDGMFDALSEAELAPWTSVFEAWDDRAILTATPVAAWGARERALSELFAMLPATPQGLREIVESFEREASPDLRAWREGESRQRWTRRGQSDVPTLRASLDPRVWRWVCACAVYPNLHWALTLYLATLPELGGGELLREEHLLRLVALPWFRDGFMPAEVRSELVDDLDEGTERAIRRTLARLLELDPPDATTAAGRWHEAQMFVQAVLANPEDEEVRAALEARVRTLPRALLLRDPAAARRLREVHHRRFDRLPRAARTLLYRDGISLFGARPWTRRSAGAATVLAIAVVPSFLWMRREQPPARVASFAAPAKLILKLGHDFELNAVARDAAGKPIADSVSWVVADTGVASVKRDSGRTLVSGRLSGATTLIVRAGDGEARIPIDVVPAITTGASVVVSMPAKRIIVGDTRQLPTARTWVLSCDASVATEMADRSFTGQAAGNTRIVSALDGSGEVELRELRVEANPSDTLAVLTAPINFERTSSQLSSVARATLSAKASRLVSDPAISLEAAIRETDALATRVPITRQRTDAITGLFAKAGIASYRVVVRAETLDYQSNDEYCQSPVRSNVTFAPIRTSLIARTIGDSASRQAMQAMLVVMPSVVGMDTLAAIRVLRARSLSYTIVSPSGGSTRGNRILAQLPRAGTRLNKGARARLTLAGAQPARGSAGDTTSTRGYSTPGNNSVQQQSPVQRRPIQSQTAIDSASGKTPRTQEPYQAPNQSPNAKPAAPSGLGVAVDSSGSRGAAGDASETSVAIRARADLRDERMLKPAPVSRSGIDAIGPMPVGTYAFASPSALIATVEKGDEKNLPVRVRRTASADFEIHNVNGVSYVAAFVDPKVASALRSSYFSSLGQLELLPTATRSATCPVEIPLSSLRAPKYVTSPTQALRVTIQPRTKDEPYVPRRVTGCPSAVMAK